MKTATQYQRFIEENFSIKNKDGKVVPFIFQNVQDKYYLDLVTHYGKDLVGVREIILKARKEGFSSFVLAVFATDFLLEDYPIASVCIANTGDETRKLLSRAKFFMESALKKKGQKLEDILDTSNTNELVNKINGASFVIGTAGSKTALRVDSVQNLHFSEAAHFPRTDILNAKEIIEGALQMVDQGKGKVFIESTASGYGNYYQNLWAKASAGLSKFRGVFFSASELYSPEWLAEKEREFTTREMFLQEYPNCLAGETRVSAHDGISPFSSHEESCKGENDVYELKTYMGYTIKATAEHQIFLNDDGSKKMGDMQVGDKVRLLSPTFRRYYQKVPVKLGLPILTQEVVVKERLALLIGIFMGNGSYYKDTLSIVFNKKDTDLIAVTKEFMESLFGRVQERIVGEQKGGVELRMTSMYLRDILLSLELVKHRPSDDRLVRRVHVPGYILNSPKSVVAAFLRGVFDTDGHIRATYPNISLFSKEEQFLRDIQLLCLGFGITSKFSKQDKKAGDGHAYIGRVLDLRTAETDLYMKEIGFITARKNERWLYKKTNLQQGHRPPIVMEDKVVSIIPAGREKVYDMEVKPEHYYSANGIKVHNSAEDAFMSSGSKFFDSMGIEYLQKLQRAPMSQGHMTNLGELSL